MNTYQDILLSKIEKSVLTISLNRPKSYNALCNNLLKELAQALDSANSNTAIKCVVITGSEKVFAAGADIKEMAELQAANDNKIKNKVPKKIPPGICPKAIGNV